MKLTNTCLCFVYSCFGPQPSILVGDQNIWYRKRVNMCNSGVETKDIDTGIGVVPSRKSDATSKPISLHAPASLRWPRPAGLTEVGACELSQDAEGARLGGAGAGLPVLRVLDQPPLATVVGDKAGHVLRPEAVPAHTPTSNSSSTLQAWEFMQHTRAHAHTPSTQATRLIGGKLWNRGHPRTQRARLDSHTHSPARRELMDSH